MEAKQNLVYPTSWEKKFQVGSAPGYDTMIVWVFFGNLGRKPPARQYAQNPHFFTVALLRFYNEGVY